VSAFVASVPRWTAWRAALLGLIVGVIAGVTIGFAVVISIPPRTDATALTSVPAPAAATIVERLQQHVIRENAGIAAVSAVTSSSTLLYQHVLRENGSVPQAAPAAREMLYQHVLRENGRSGTAPASRTEQLHQHVLRENAAP
jgi:hypothetical protein